MSNYKKNDIVTCEISGIVKYGLFVKLEDGYSGLIHISEISNKYVNDINKQYSIGDVVDAKIIDINEEKKQVKLSIKSFKKSKNKLVENGNGFLPLKSNLEMWVNNKLMELEK